MMKKLFAKTSLKHLYPFVHTKKIIRTPGSFSNRKDAVKGFQEGRGGGGRAPKWKTQKMIHRC